MGEVVQLDTPGDDEHPRPARRQRGQSKTALVLGGGGFTGGVYEIGALRALDLLTVDRNVNDFDIYVGTSAGSFVASLLANGVTPEEMMRVLNPRLPSPIREMDLDAVLRPNYRGFAARSLQFPLRLFGLARELAGHLNEVTLMDVATGLAGALPTGLYDGKGIEEYVAEVLADPDRTDDFRLVDSELYLPATDLDTSERVVLGEGAWGDLPISTAVAASTALPMVYKPIELRGRQLVDGGIRSTTNVDIAVERGAKFIVVVNPIVPYVNDFSAEAPAGLGARPRRVADMGFAAVGNQAFRILSHDRLHRAVEDWDRKFPGVDIILIEPEPHDELMFGTSILDYSARLQIAKHGFESVSLRLARDYDRYKSIADRHGIEISGRRVRHVLDSVEREEEQVSAWRRVLEQTTGALLRQTGSD